MLALARLRPKSSRSESPGDLSTAREDDSESGLMHFRARSYDARTGRFEQQDPVIGNAHSEHFVYAGNDPISRKDPLGEFWWWNPGSRDWEWIPEPAEPYPAPEHSRSYASAMSFVPPINSQAIWVIPSRGVSARRATSKEIGSLRTIAGSVGIWAAFSKSDEDLRSEEKFAVIGARESREFNKALALTVVGTFMSGGYAAVGLGLGRAAIAVGGLYGLLDSGSAMAGLYDPAYDIFGHGFESYAGPHYGPGLRIGVGVTVGVLSSLKPLNPSVGPRLPSITPRQASDLIGDMATRVNAINAEIAELQSALTGVRVSPTSAVTRQKRDF